ncbi:hypothetical protein AHF37_06503, partial [Paragonimus kellicotti]
VTETEIHYQNTAPVFTTRLTLEYFFEEKQIITAEIFQCDREDREDSRLLGFVQCTVGRVIHSGGELQLMLTCEDEKQSAVGREDATIQPIVIVCIREDPFSKENIYLKMQGFNLDKKDFFGKSDPYVIIYRRNERGNDLIGEFTTTVSELLQAKENVIEFKLINPPKKKRKKYYQHSGQLHVRLMFAQSKFSFLDYIFGGLAVAEAEYDHVPQYGSEEAPLGA